MQAFRGSFTTKCFKTFFCLFLYSITSKTLKSVQFPFQSTSSTHSFLFHSFSSTFLSLSFAFYLMQLFSSHSMSTTFIYFFFFTLYFPLSYYLSPLAYLSPWISFLKVALCLHLMHFSLCPPSCLHTYILHIKKLGISLHSSHRFHSFLHSPFPLILLFFLFLFQLLSFLLHFPIPFFSLRVPWCPPNFAFSFLFHFSLEISAIPSKEL